mgnify:CR=1 FL=1
MLFTSYGFILFLCVVIGLYYIIPKKFQWKLLLVSSFVFYFFSGWSNLLYISVTIVSTYLIGLKLDSLAKQHDIYLKENKEALAGKNIVSYACQSGKGAETALKKLEELTGESFRVTAVFIEPKRKTSPETDSEIEDFCREINSV